MKNASITFITFDAQDVITTSSTVDLSVAWIKPVDVEGYTSQLGTVTAFYREGTNGQVMFAISTPSAGTFEGSATSNYQLIPDVNNFCEMESSEYFAVVTSGATDSPQGRQLTQIADIVEWINTYGKVN